MVDRQVLSGNVVLPERVLSGGAVVIEAETIAWVGRLADLPEDYASAPREDVGDGFIVPGFVDVHCHGGGGASFPDATTLEEVRVAANEHLRRGTTTLVASLVTAAIPVLEERAALLSDAVNAGIIAGIHYEGPFLSQARCGAQNPAFLVPATAEDARKLVAAADGNAVSMTLAPERCLDEEGRRAVEVLVEGAILPSWGHSDCTTAQANAAVTLGEETLEGQTPLPRGGRASVTHLFNGMPPMHHRAPGPIPALIAAAQEGRIVAEMICDGVHLDPLLVAEVVKIVGRENAVFVTDAMAAAGMEDGDYVLGPNEVTVKDGVARLTHGGNLAGGTSHLVDQVRTAVVEGGIALEDAVYLATVQGARFLGLDDRGAVAAGLRADLVLMDQDLRFAKAYRAGHPVSALVG